jgi:hypothetical protein
MEMCGEVVFDELVRGERVAFLLVEHWESRGASEAPSFTVCARPQSRGQSLAI